MPVTELMFGCQIFVTNLTCTTEFTHSKFNLFLDNKQYHSIAIFTCSQITICKQKFPRTKPVWNQMPVVKVLSLENECA